MAARALSVRDWRPTESARILSHVTRGARRSAVFGFVRGVARGALRVLAFDLRHGLVAAAAIERRTCGNAVRLVALETRSGMRSAIGLLVAVETDRRHTLEQMRHVASGAHLVSVRR